MREYVVGFLFDTTCRRVALVEKHSPKWQRGLLNGIGGKIESHESPYHAMVREFQEEAGAVIRTWRLYCELSWVKGRVYFYEARGAYKLRSKTTEAVRWYAVKDIQLLPILDNLTWLLPLALDSWRPRAKIGYTRIPAQLT